MTVARYGLVSGRVQGVGFRYFVQRCAIAERIAGWARNLADGRVEVLLVGDADAVAQLEQRIAAGPAAAKVEGWRWEDRADAPVLLDFTTA